MLSLSLPFEFGDEKDSDPRTLLFKSCKHLLSHTTYRVFKRIRGNLYSFLFTSQPWKIFSLSCACLLHHRNPGPSQCTRQRQTDRMAAGLKTIIALSFVCFDLPLCLFPLLSPFIITRLTSYPSPSRCWPSASSSSSSHPPSFTAI